MGPVKKRGTHALEEVENAGQSDQAQSLPATITPRSFGWLHSFAQATRQGISYTDATRYFSSSICNLQPSHNQIICCYQSFGEHAVVSMIEVRKAQNYGKGVKPLATVLWRHLNECQLASFAAPKCQSRRADVVAPPNGPRLPDELKEEACSKLQQAFQITGICQASYKGHRY